MRFAFYISGQSGRLKKFLKQTGDRFADSIKVVVSEYDIEDELLELLREKNIPTVVYLYENLGDTIKARKLKFSDCLLYELRRYDVDYCFSFGSHILVGQILEVYKNRLINFHPSLLPMYPGVKAIDQAVDDNRAMLIGNTVHFIDEGVDSGPIIMQSVIPVKAFQDTLDYNVVLDLQIEMLVKTIRIIETGSLDVVEGKAVIKGADYKGYTIFPCWEEP